MKWSMFLVLLFGSLGFAADPMPKVDPPKPAATVKLSPGKPITVLVGKKCVVTVDTTAKKVTWTAPAGVDLVAVNGKDAHVWANPGVYELAASVPSGDDVLSTKIVLTVVGPRPPPTPPGPTPTPDDPPSPTPVAKSFRVIWVIDPLITPEPGQTAAVDAEKTRNYLIEKTTADQQWAGWRKYSPRENVENETATFKALWAEVMKNPPKTNAVVIEVDGKIYIEPIPKSADAVLELFKSKNGGK